MRIFNEWEVLTNSGQCFKVHFLATQIKCLQCPLHIYCSLFDKKNSNLFPFSPLRIWKRNKKKFDGLFCHRLLNYSQETIIIIDEAFIVFCLRFFTASDSYAKYWFYVYNFDWQYVRYDAMPLFPKSNTQQKVVFHYW